ncbi:hypothetical protein QW131_15305 [Roseibium salinum]|nr:hypothetical protein [Roseibium salinum]
MTSAISDIVVPRVFTPYMAENKPAKLVMLEKVRHPGGARARDCQALQGGRQPDRGALLGGSR